MVNVGVEMFLPYTDLFLLTVYPLVGMVKQMSYRYIMKYNAAIEKDEILLFVTTWMELEAIMLSKINQAQKDKHYVISLTWNLKKLFS